MLYVIACGLGYWSHFIVKFPKEYYLIFIAIAAYGILVLIHTYIERFLEKEAFYLGKSVSNSASINLL